MVLFWTRMRRLVQTRKGKLIFWLHHLSRSPWRVSVSIKWLRSSKARNVDAPRLCKMAMTLSSVCHVSFTAWAKLSMLTKSSNGMLRCCFDSEKKNYMQKHYSNEYSCHTVNVECRCCSIKLHRQWHDFLEIEVSFHTWIQFVKGPTNLVRTGRPQHQSRKDDRSRYFWSIAHLGQLRNLGQRLFEGWYCDWWSDHFELVGLRRLTIVVSERDTHPSNDVDPSARRWYERLRNRSRCWLAALPLHQLCMLQHVLFVREWTQRHNNKKTHQFDSMKQRPSVETMLHVKINENSKDETAFVKMFPLSSRTRDELCFMFLPNGFALLNVDDEPSTHWHFVSIFRFIRCSKKFFVDPVCDRKPPYLSPDHWRGLW